MKDSSTKGTFNFVAQKPRPGVVYHCISVAPKGDCIRPSGGYGADISQDVRRRLGMAPEEHAPLIFASAHMTKALAFGLQGTLQEKILNGSIAGSDGEMVLCCDREKLMARARNVTVYGVSDKDFVTLDYADRQCVSTKPIPFGETKVAFRASSAEGLMRGGLQILAFNETYTELQGYDFVEKTMKERGHENLDQFLGDMIREGKIIWENRERGINPDPALAKNIGVDLQPQPEVRDAKDDFAKSGGKSPEVRHGKNDATYVKTSDGHLFFGAKGAAGSLVLAQKTGRLMLQRRSVNVQEPGTFGTIGGAIEEGSNPRQTAAEELFEETGYRGPVCFEPLSVFRSSGGEFSYHNFLAVVPDEFTPWQDGEADGARWFDLGDWPQPLHFGVKSLLSDPAAIDKITQFVAAAKEGRPLPEDKTGRPGAENLQNASSRIPQPKI